ncbi:adenylate kinase isoenzyme 6-like protein [Vairimorpha necatrix]|uniref:Adenylate kinase isoenzyme 6-like protein n=1 Tax=Vairimorpha necatrix TaxID=6039 RepID=A0AAX4JDN2_9MICR
MKILITGTPGAGKSTLSNEISHLYNIPHIDISKYIKENKLYDSKDHKLDTLIFDKDNVRNHLLEYLQDKESFIIDTHSPLLVDFIKFDFTFLVKVSTEVLYTRLRQRGYSKMKIKENINCEIFEVIEDYLSEMDFPFYLVGEEEGFLTKDDVISQIGKCKLYK